MNDALRALVRRRAADSCEYCRLRQSDSPLAALHIEHIIPKKHGGSDDEGNLALACVDCNLHKGPNLTGIDSISGTVVQLFHPRQQAWEDHFEWSGVYIVGKTPSGRATIDVLNMNSEDQLALRSS
jgi:hypothetical protein